MLDVTLLEPRAMRLFEAADLDKSGQIGITEFEVALMMNDGKILCVSNRNIFSRIALESRRAGPRADSKRHISHV